MLCFGRKKKSPEVLDLVDLQKRGLFKPKPQVNNGIIDLTKNPTGNTEDASPLGFLGAMASSSAAGSSFSSSEASPNINEYPSISSNELSTIKERIESVSYRLSRILDRLEVVEKKIERLDRARI